MISGTGLTITSSPVYELVTQASFMLFALRRIGGMHDHSSSKFF